MTSPKNLLRVTVLLFHPFIRRSQTNRTLYESIKGCPDIEVRDMYDLYPEFSIDVEAEQSVLDRSDVVVFQHPIYWYNCPSLMKEWIDAVFERGWAYGPGGDHLKGKYWLQVVSTGGPEEAYHREGYNRFSIHELLRPFEQSAVLCGMIPIQPMLTTGTFRMTEEDRLHQGKVYRDLLIEMSKGKIPPTFSSLNLKELP